MQNFVHSPDQLVLQLLVHKVVLATFRVQGKYDRDVEMGEPRRGVERAASNPFVDAEVCRTYESAPPFHGDYRDKIYILYCPSASPGWVKTRILASAVGGSLSGMKRIFEGNSALSNVLFRSVMSRGPRCRLSFTCADRLYVW